MKLRVNSASKAGAILPTHDLMFKTIFWNKEYPNVLISFINSILKRKDPIKSVELVNTEMDTQFIGEHGIRLDLIATTSNGAILNVEMQKHCDSSRMKNNDVLREQGVSTSVETNMFKRSLFYWAKIYSSQLKQSQYYKELHPVIAINILDFILFKNDNDCHRSFVLKNNKTNEEYLRMLEIHFVELNKRKYMDQNDELWAWTEFLKAPNSYNLNEKRTEINSLYDAQFIFNKARSNSLEREKIRLLEKTKMDNLSAIHYAKEEGLKQGKEEGLAEGLEKGKQKGKLENQKQIALNMKSKGFDNDTIAQCLNISIDKLKELLSE